jgi:type VI secretion system protein ImpL
MKRILVGTIVFLVYLLCVIGAAFALHFSGTRFWLFCIVLGLLGAATIGFAVWYLSRMDSQFTSGGSDVTNLDALLRDADSKLRNSRLGVKSLSGAQIVYVVGEDNAAKTQTVLQSGLDAELLAGNLYRDGVVAPTQLANIWLAGRSVIIEAGGALLRRPALWQRLVRATRPGRLRSLFVKRAKQPARAVVVCVSSERVPGAKEAGYNANAIRASAQSLNQRLRDLSQTLGISVPVYVLFTKVDTAGRFADLDHFGDYCSRLTAEEVNLPLGSLLAPLEAASGLYAERASALVAERLDELIYELSEFRIEVLARGGEPRTLASAYEFPRDLRKRRDTLIDYLVELTRPSQLGINPFLRGFFFSGMRAVVREEVVAAPVQQRPAGPVDAGATIAFSVAGGQLHRPAPQQAPRMSASRVPQWVFLPHLFSNLLLKDQSALEASRASTKVNLLKRTLLGCVCGCILVYLVLLTISFFNNLDLAQQVSKAATVPVFAATQTQFASAHDLQTLDQLGGLVLLLDRYRKDGPPQMHRWGLYTGDALLPVACNAYSIKVRALLLGPAQANILAQLGAVQSPPPAGADYLATYNPLKAYLITTSNPEKSTPDFLPPVLLAAWAGAAAVPPELSRQALRQFTTYATLLSEPQSCMAGAGGQPDRATVDRARDYLSHFGGSQHIYQSILANANREVPAVHFNDNPAYPNSAHYIVDPYQVPGAFTKPGFAYMQDAIQHPERYYKDDDWVLGTNAGPSTDSTTFSAQIDALYVADYIFQWRNYLTQAHFVKFPNWNDAATKLSVLDSPSSPILELFSLISINTRVALPDIAKAFEAPQSVVPPSNPPDRFTAPSNQPYMTALTGLEGAIEENANPLNQNDPAAAAQVQQAAIAAKQAAELLRNNSFPPDPVGKMDDVSYHRLEDPIDSVLDLANGMHAAAANGGGKDFCAQAEPVLDRFPFNRKAPPSSPEASPQDVADFFSPQGALAKLESNEGQFVVLANGKWVNKDPTVNPRFVDFLNATQKVALALFPPGGGNVPTLSFTLKESNEVPDAVLSIGDEQVSASQTKNFRWRSSPESRIIYTTAEKPNTIATGPWSVFHLAFDDARPGPYTILPIVRSNGQSKPTVKFEIGGAGRDLLDPQFMDRLHCVTAVVKP